MTRTISTVLLAAMVLVLCGGCGSAYGRETGNQSTDKRVVKLVNRARARGTWCGGRFYRPARPVTWNETLGRASLKHCLFMADRGLLCHTSYYGGGTGKWLSKFGYNWLAYGENIGEGYRTAEEVVRGWLKSPDHCENIMNPAYKEAGSSYARGSQKTYWTLMLAAPGKRSLGGR